MLSTHATWDFYLATLQNYFRKRYTTLEKQELKVLLRTEPQFYCRNTDFIVKKLFEMVKFDKLKINTSYIYLINK